MKRACIVLCLALVAASGASSAAKAATRYEGVALARSSDGATLVPRHYFAPGDRFTLRFRDRQGTRTRYRVCLVKDGADDYCVQGRTGARTPAGWSQQVLYATAQAAGSQYAYRWYVRGVVVARWAVTIRDER